MVIIYWSINRTVMKEKKNMGVNTGLLDVMRTVMVIFFSHTSRRMTGMSNLFPECQAVETMQC